MTTADRREKISDLRDSVIEINDELESAMDELKELKANPNKHATGTCLEANLSEGEGVQATLLVRDGTLVGWTEVVESGCPNSSGISMLVDGNGVAPGVTPVNGVTPAALGVIAGIGDIYMDRGAHPNPG